MSDQHSRLPSRSRVNVRSTLTVVSSRPREPSTMAHPLSVLDHAMGNHALHIVFYYKNRKGGLDFERLRPSLCEVLSMYPMVTGRLGKDGNGNWKVRCNDAGVRVLRANVVGVGMDEWLTSADFEEEMDLTVWDDLPDDDPHIWSPFRIQRGMDGSFDLRTELLLPLVKLFLIITELLPLCYSQQITEFERGGLAIGLSCTHLLADPTCATLLINSWTEYHRREASLSHPPSIHPAPALQPRPNPNLNTESVQFYASKASGFTAATPQPQFKKMSTATFSFSDSSIRNSLLKINTTDSQTNASPFDFLTALFWTRITRVKAERSSDDFDKQCNSLTICKDMRNLLHAPLPYGYFGNALNFTKLSLDVELFIKDGGDVRRVANLVSNHVSGLKEEGEEAEFMSAIDWFHSRKDENGKLPPPFRMYGPELTCVSMEHMIAGSSSGDAGIGSKCEPLMYAAKFEKDEKPVHVSYRMGNVGGAQGEEEGFILVMPSPEGGMARRVTVTLPEEEMASLCDDEEIKRLEPTPILCGRR